MKRFRTALLESTLEQAERGERRNVRRAVSQDRGGKAEARLGIATNSSAPFPVRNAAAFGLAIRLYPPINRIDVSR